MVEAALAGRLADETWMRMALDLAEEGRGWVEPNPLVGCVLVRDGKLIGQGFHRRFGGPHAEVEALADCDDTRGATAFVTLEPCCHHGKTPPCSAALIKAGIARVVVAMRDPFPRVDGGGLAELRQAGIETSVGLLEDAARELNAAYLKRVETGRPWVIAKWAMTIDGRIATVAGESQWITGEASRRQVHRLRGRVDAVAVGMGTVEADDPALTARLVDEAGRPEPPRRLATRVVFSRRRTPSPHSQLFRSLEAAPLAVVTGPGIPARRVEELRTLGAAVHRVDSDDPARMVLDALAWSADPEPSGPAWPGGVPATNWLVEGGSELLASFFSADQVDECHVYLGPLLFGGRDAPGPVGGAGIDRLIDARRWKLIQTDRFEDDARLIYRRRISPGITRF